MKRSVALSRCVRTICREILRMRLSFFSPSRLSPPLTPIATNVVCIDIRRNIRRSIPRVFRTNRFSECLRSFQWRVVACIFVWRPLRVLVAGIFYNPAFCTHLQHQTGRAPLPEHLHRPQFHSDHVQRQQFNQVQVSKASTRGSRRKTSGNRDDS